MTSRAETDEDSRLLYSSCFCTDAEPTPGSVQSFEELRLNSFRPGINRTRQCGGHATSGRIECADSCTGELVHPVEANRTYIVFLIVLKLARSAVSVDLTLPSGSN